MRVNILIIAIILLSSISIKAQNKFFERQYSFKEQMKKYRNPISDLEKTMINMGLVDIEKLDSTFVVNIVYSTPNNFVGVDLYGGFSKCYLQKDVAEKLILAQKHLKKINPNLSIMIYDGARPRSVQQKMWDVVQMPIEEKVKFLSNPKRGSIHNYGCAVDVGLATNNGEEVDMGSPFDHMGIEAHPVAEQKLLAEGVLTDTIVKNRQLLRNIMHKAGFYNIQTEWWHFNSCRREVAMEKYQIIE